MNKFLLFLGFIAFFATPAISQTADSKEKRVEVRLILRESYDYYIYKNPSAIRGEFIDKQGIKHLVFFEMEALKEAARTLKIEELLSNKPDANKTVVYVAVVSMENQPKNSAYTLVYDQEGNFQIKD